LFKKNGNALKLVQSQILKKHFINIVMAF